MRYEIQQRGTSRSFPDGDPFYEGAHVGANEGAQEGACTLSEVLVLLGAPLVADAGRAAIVIELGTECLGVHTAEDAGLEGSNVLGFNRFRNGADAPSALIELVRQPQTPDSAIDAARSIFEDAGLTVVVCADQAGRILDRLVRPKYNAALRFLDEGLASAADMDLTCCLGLGYPDGPIERTQRGGLDYHHDVTRALFDVYGTPGYAPARRAVVAHQRRKAGSSD